MTNINITIGSRSFQSTNDAVASNLMAFINQCLTVGAIQEVNGIPSGISLSGIVENATTTPEKDSKSRKVSPAEDTTVNITFTPHKVDKETYYLVEFDKYVGTATYGVLMDKLSEYPKIKCAVQRTAGPKSRKHTPGMTYIQEVPAVSAAVKKKMPTTVSATAAEIEARRAKIAEKYNK